MKKLLGLIPDEEEEQPENFETKDISNNVDISDFTPDEIVMGDQPVDEGEKIELVNVQIETVKILDDDTEIDIASTEEEKKDQTKDIQVEDVQMTEQHEREPKRGEEK